MDYKTIIYETKGKIAFITINRPQSRNALNSQVFSEMNAALSDADKDGEIKVIILTGGEKYFAAGADISEMGQLLKPTDAHRFLQNAHTAYNKIEAIEKPVIAAVSGFAFGGGCELALACDLRIASENAVFGQPEIKIGVLPGAGGTQRLPRIIGVSKAKELLFTGGSIGAQEAYRLGLVNKIVPIGSVVEEATMMGESIAAQPGFALKLTKSAINNGLNMSIKEALAYEARCFEILFSTDDQKLGMDAFINKTTATYTDG